jgi:hypothetical protein
MIEGGESNCYQIGSLPIITNWKKTLESSSILKFGGGEGGVKGRRGGGGQEIQYIRSEKKQKPSQKTRGKEEKICEKAGNRFLARSYTVKFHFVHCNLITLDISALYSV